MPFLFLMVVCSIIFLNMRKKYYVQEWIGKGRYKLYLLLFIPLLIMSVVYIITNGRINSSFLISMAVTLLVGIGEELTFRRILFTGMLKNLSFSKAVLLSAIVFSLLHFVNIFAGMPFPQMMIQLVTTFFAGLYYELMYAYTKNIYLMIFEHWLWDYILLSGVSTKIQVFGAVMIAMTIAQFVVMLILLKKIKKEAL